MVKPRQSREAQTPTILVSERWVMAQPTFRLGVNDVRAGHPMTRLPAILGHQWSAGTMSAADVLPSSHHIVSRCGSTASSTRKPFGFSGNAAGQSDEQRLKPSPLGACAGKVGKIGK